MQANDIGKVRLASEREAKRARRADPVVDEEPWKPRFLSRQQNKPKKSLVSHDDDDSYDE
jgi:hypothetical protein